jgi:hypothetical protein
MLVLYMIEMLPPLGKYKYNTLRILPVKCYIDNYVCLRSCIRNINMHLCYFCANNISYLSCERLRMARLDTATS